jgi:glycosyltransferase involved in cell wall biosynthesis
MNPLVSILIPAYNSAPWIAETIQSVVNQTWPNKEIIVVVDDGCTDQTLAVARQFASPTVSVVTRPHQSVAAARNEAFKICQGDYIQWLDADDLLAPDKIALQMQAAEQIASRRTLLSAEWAFFFFRTAKARFHPTPLWCDLPPAEWLLRKMGQGDHMQPATWLVRREIIEAAGAWIEDLRVDEDGEYFCRLVLASDGIRFVPGAKVFYRVSGSSSTTVKAFSRPDDRWRTMQLQFAHLRSLGDSEPVRTACINFLQIWLIFFYPQRMDIVEQAQQLAASVGGRLDLPKLRWKYAWIEKIWGCEKARQMQFLLPQIKTEALRRWDKAMYHLENRKPARH